MELCAGRVEGKREEGAEVPLVMFINGDSGFGVEDADEAEREGVGKKSSSFVIAQERWLLVDIYNRRYTLNK